MQRLEKVRQWVQTFPLWEEGQLLYIDHTGCVPGNSGLFSQGAQELARLTDILGNTTVRCRCSFSLYRVTTGQEDGAANAQWLLAFQNWVQEQSVLGLAPVFGDAPEQERLWAQKGRLKQADQTGTGIYSVELIAEYVKKFTA